MTKNYTTITKDHAIRDYFKQPEHFADCFNALIFKGQQVIHPEELTIIDGDHPYVSLFQSMERRRDVLMLYKLDDVELILGLEAQNNVDYTMSSRKLLYDAITYSHMDQKKKDHHIPPVITIVLFHGGDTWNASLSIHDRIGLEQYRNFPALDLLISRIDNWHLDLFDIKEIDSSLFHDPDNEMLFRIIQHIYKKDFEPIKSITISESVMKVVIAFINRDINIEFNVKEDIQMTTILQMVMMDELMESERVGMIKGESLGLEKGERLGLEKGERIGLEKGERIGLEKGERIGLEKGEKIGSEKGGKAEFIRAIEITLEIEYGYVDKRVMDIIKTLSKEKMKELMIMIKRCHNQEELLKMLNHNS